MPTNVVKTQADEEKWQKAKAIAAAKGEEENYAYIMGIYKRMNPERFAAARVADRYASSPLIKELDEDYHSLWHDRAEAAGEGWTCSLKEGVDPCGKMTLKEFIAKWKKHGLKAVKVQRLPTTYSYYDCSSHATLRTEQMHGVSRGNLRDLELDWNTPIPWSKAKKGDWVKWPNHHGVVIDPKRKIVESCWGVDGWVFQHPVDLSTYGGKPTVHSVRLKEKTASSDGQCRVASSPFSELSPEGAEAFGSFCASLTHWLGMAQYENLNVMYRIWKGSKELQGWLSRHVNKSSYTLYYGRRITDNEKTVSVGDILSRKGRGKVFYWSTDLKRASGFATVVGPTDQTDFQSAVGEAKVSGKKVIVDVDRLISFCTRHKEDVARLTWGDAVGLLTGGGDYEGEVLTTPVNATVIRAEFYADPKRKKEAAPSSVSVRPGFSRLWSALHLSSRFLGENTTLRTQPPRDPYEDSQRFVIEDQETDRISVAESIADAIKGLGASSANGYHVYAAGPPRNKVKVIDPLLWWKGCPSSDANEYGPTFDWSEYAEAEGIDPYHNTEREDAVHLCVPDLKRTREKWLMEPTKMVWLGEFRNGQLQMPQEHLDYLLDDVLQVAESKRDRVLAKVKVASVAKEARSVVAYHGSNVPIRRFDRSKAAMGVFWFSDDKGAVERGEKANRTDWLMTARLDVGSKIAGWDEYDKLGLYELERQFDSVHLDDDWIIFDPSKIKVLKMEEIDRGRRASPTRVAVRSKSSSSVKVEVLPRPTEKARKSYGKTIAVGRFKSSIPLFRVMDGEELRQVWDTGDIKGGEYAVPGERAFGAQWGASLPEVAKWGDTQRGKRLGHELFVAEIDGKGRVFAHLNGANGQLQPDSGTVDLDSSFCNTGLGCSTHVQKRKVKQWYVVDENGSPRKATAAEIDDMLNEVGWKPRKVTLWMGHHFNRLPSKIAKALAWETLQMEATYAKSREETRDLRRRQHESGAKPLDKDKLGRLLFSYLGKEAPAWWETASSVAERDALPSRANGTDSFAVMFSIVTETVVPYQGADMPRVGEAQAKQIELYIPALKRWERIWSPWGKGAPLTFTDDAIFVGR